MVSEDNIESNLYKRFRCWCGDRREQLVEVFLIRGEAKGHSRVKNTYGNESSLYFTLNESLVPRKGSEELDVRRHPNDLVLVQRLPQHPQRLRPIPTMHNKLGNHRVIKHTNLRTLSETLFQPDRRFDISRRRRFHGRGWCELRRVLDGCGGG